MDKVFLYLYPIEEYNRVFLHSDEFYNQMNRDKPFSILDECIQKRYREHGYQIVYVLYSDKEMFGVSLVPGDKKIYTDISFEEASGYNKDGSKKSKDDIKYPNEQYLIEQLGNVVEIVIGGFHFGDCVKRVAEYCYQSGIDTLVDLEMTDLFFNLYYKDYFRVDEYSLDRFKQYQFQRFSGMELAFFEKQFEAMYSSPVYGLYSEQSKKRK